EKSFVLEYWARQRCSELVLMIWRGFVAEIVVECIARVERVIANVFERCAVEGIAAGLRHHIHNTASRSSELGFSVVPDDLEFLNEIDVRQHDIRRTTNVGIDDSVKEIKFRAILLPMERSIREPGARQADIALAASDTSILRRRYGSCSRR